MADPIVHITSGLPDAGTGNITTLGMTINAIGSTTSGQSGPLVMGAVTTTPPTYTTAQTNPLSLTTTGLLRVDGSGVTQPISGSITVSGTTTVSGTVTANQGGAPWTMKPDGTAWAQTGTSANVNVTNASIPVTGTFWQATQPVSGTVAATQSGTWTVQPGNTANTTAWLVTGTGGTFPITATSLPLPSGASTSANQPTNAAQGSTTSGQTGHLMMGAVTTGTPTYTTAQTSPFSLDTSGALRVNVIAGGGGGGTSSTFGSAIPATGTAGGFSDGTNMQLARVFDGDTGVGTQYSLGVLLKTPGSGGAVDFGVSGQPIRIDPTGTTTQPVSGTVGISGTVAATQSGTWTVQPGNTANTTAWLVTGAGGTFPVTGTFWQATQPVSIAATVNTSASQSGTWTVQPGNTANTTPWLVLPALTAASNGLTSSRVAAAATTNATSLKASAGEMARIDVFNTATYAVFLKFYNKASSPTVGTDTPVWTIPVSAGGGYSTEFMRGKYS